VRFESPELMAKQQEMAIKGVNRDTLPRGISRFKLFIISDK
jgi:hypothetical protein